MSIAPCCSVNAAFLFAEPRLVVVVSRCAPQLLRHMNLLDVPLGLLINFHEMQMTDSIGRLILPGANQ